MVRDRRPSTLENAALRYLGKRRGRAAWSGPPRAGRAAAALLKPLAKKFGPGLDALSEHWPEIVGERLAEWCAPESIRGGVLTVRARGPAGAVIEAEQRRILQRVAAYAGARAPTRLRVIQGAIRAPVRPHLPVTQAPAMQEKVEEPPRDRLDSALRRWDRAVQAREDREKT